jgi:hypothetical protein
MLPDGNRSTSPVAPPDIVSPLDSIVPYSMFATGATVAGPAGDGSYDLQRAIRYLKQKTAKCRLTPSLMESSQALAISCQKPFLSGPPSNHCAIPRMRADSLECQRMNEDKDGSRQVTQRMREYIADGCSTRNLGEKYGYSVHVTNHKR